MLGNAILLPKSSFEGMHELNAFEIDMISGADWGWGDTAAAAGAVSGVAWGVAEVAGVIPGGQGVAAVAGLVAGVAGAVAGVSGAVAYWR